MVDLPADLLQGWDLADEPPKDWDPGRRQELLASALSFKPKVHDEGIKVSQRNWPFRVSKEGVFKRMDKKDKDSGEISTRWVKVCSELRVLAETRDFETRN